MVKLMAGSFRQVLWAVCAAAVLLAEGAPRELARFGLDEGFGSVSDDAVAGQVATLGRETKWAKGAFGCAADAGAAAVRPVVRTFLKASSSASKLG